MGNSKENGSGNEMPMELAEAVEELQLLLAYAAQKGVEVTDEHIKVVVESKNKITSGPLEPDAEVQFWHVYQEVARQVQPVTVESLKASSDRFGKQSRLSLLGGSGSGKVSKAKLAVRRYQKWSILALVLLLIGQIYTLFGSTVIVDIDDISKNIGRNENLLSDLFGQVDQGPTESQKQEIRDIELKINRMTDRLLANYELLRVWDLFILGEREDFGGREDVGEREDFGAREEIRAENLTLLQTGRITLESLSRYVLPLLYGMLGACAYVLRSLAIETRSLTYTEESDIRFQLRIYLGALAGLAVAWFITEETAPGLLTTITPLALAFLAGYSVELVFAAMDALISAFSRDRGAKA